MNNVALYSRVSTDGQEKDGTSLDTQERACFEFAIKKGWSVVEKIRDTASGATLDRPGILKLRNMLKSGAINIVLSYSVDRLSRDQIHTAVLLDDIEKVGATLEFVTESFDNTPVGRLILQVRAFSGEVEREKIAERTLRGKVERARSGKLPQATGKGIYGYTYNQKSGTREINPEQAEVVKEIFTDFTAHSSCHGISVELNQKGIPSFSGGIWHPLTVRRILQNETYTGKTVYRRTKAEKIFDHRTGKQVRKVTTREEKDWIEIPDATPQIISRELYKKVQNILGDPDRNIRRKIGTYRLSGRLKCLKCSTPMVGHAQARGKYRYYRCRKSYSGDSTGNCQSRYIRQSLLEKTVLYEISQVISNPEVIVSEIMRYNSRNGEREAEKESLKSKLNLMVEKESRLAQLYIDGSISKEILDQKKNALARRKSELLEQQRIIENDSYHNIDMDELSKKMQQVASRIKEWIEAADGETFDLLMNSLDVKVKASKQKVHITGSVPFVPENDENFVTIEQTSALRRGCNLLYLLNVPRLGWKDSSSQMQPHRHPERQELPIDIYC